jgi:hypothetical protein
VPLVLLRNCGFRGPILAQNENIAQLRNYDNSNYIGILYIRISKYICIYFHISGCLKANNDTSKIVVHALHFSGSACTTSLPD